MDTVCIEEIKESIYKLLHSQLKDVISYAFPFIYLLQHLESYLLASNYNQTKLNVDTMILFCVHQITQLQSSDLQKEQQIAEHPWRLFFINILSCVDNTITNTIQKRFRNLFISHLKSTTSEYINNDSRKVIQNITKKGILSQTFAKTSPFDYLFGAEFIILFVVSIYSNEIQSAYQLVCDVIINIQQLLFTHGKTLYFSNNSSRDGRHERTSNLIHESSTIKFIIMAHVLSLQWIISCMIQTSVMIHPDDNQSFETFSKQLNQFSIKFKSILPIASFIIRYTMSFVTMYERYDLLKSLIGIDYSNNIQELSQISIKPLDSISSFQNLQHIAKLLSLSPNASSQTEPNDSDSQLLSYLRTLQQFPFSQTVTASDMVQSNPVDSRMALPVFDDEDIQIGRQFYHNVTKEQASVVLSNQLQGSFIIRPVTGVSDDKKSTSYCVSVKALSEGDRPNIKHVIIRKDEMDPVHGERFQFYCGKIGPIRKLMDLLSEISKALRVELLLNHSIDDDTIQSLMTPIEQQSPPDAKGAGYLKILHLDLNHSCWIHWHSRLDSLLQQLDSDDVFITDAIEGVHEEVGDGDEVCINYDMHNQSAMEHDKLSNDLNSTDDSPSFETRSIAGKGVPLEVTTGADVAEEMKSTDQSLVLRGSLEGETDIWMEQESLWSSVASPLRLRHLLEQVVTFQALQTLYRSILSIKSVINRSYTMEVGVDYLSNHDWDQPPFIKTQTGSLYNRLMLLERLNSIRSEENPSSNTMLMKEHRPDDVELLIGSIHSLTKSSSNGLQTKLESNGSLHSIELFDLIIRPLEFLLFQSEQKLIASIIPKLPRHCVVFSNPEPVRITSMDDTHQANPRKTTQKKHKIQMLLAERLIALIMCQLPKRLVRVFGQGDGYGGHEYTVECMDTFDMKTLLEKWRGLTVQRIMHQFYLRSKREGTASKHRLHFEDSTSKPLKPSIEIDEKRLPKKVHSKKKKLNTNGVMLQAQESLKFLSISNVHRVMKGKGLHVGRAALEEKEISPLKNEGMFSDAILDELDQINEYLGIDQSCNAKECSEIYINWMISLNILEIILKPPDHAFALATSYYRYIDSWEVKALQDPSLASEPTKLGRHLFSGYRSLTTGATKQLGSNAKPIVSRDHAVYNAVLTALLMASNNNSTKMDSFLELWDSLRCETWTIEMICNAIDDTIHVNHIESSSPENGAGSLQYNRSLLPCINGRQILQTNHSPETWNHFRNDLQQYQLNSHHSYNDCIQNYLYKNALFARLRIPLRYIAVLQLDIYNLKEVVSTVSMTQSDPRFSKSPQGTYFNTGNEMEWFPWGGPNQPVEVTSAASVHSTFIDIYGSVLLNKSSNDRGSGLIQRSSSESSLDSHSILMTSVGKNAPNGTVITTTHKADLIRIQAMSSKIVKREDNALNGQHVNKFQQVLSTVTCNPSDTPTTTATTPSSSGKQTLSQGNPSTIPLITRRIINESNNYVWRDQVLFRFALQEGIRTLQPDDIWRPTIPKASADSTILSDDVILEQECLLQDHLFTPPNTISLSLFERNFFSDAKLGVVHINLIELNEKRVIRDWYPLVMDNINHVNWFVYLQIKLNFKLMSKDEEPFIVQDQSKPSNSTLASQFKSSPPSLEGSSTSYGGFSAKKSSFLGHLDDFF